MTDFYLHTPKWTLTAQRGCCGIGTISRLGAVRYLQETELEREAEGWRKSKPTRPNVSMLCGRTLKSMAQCASTQAWTPCLPTLEEGYWALLEDCRESAKYAVYFLSDNVHNQGDVHLGGFATRHFVKWLQLNELGSVVSTGPVQSLRTGHNIQGWMFTPNWGVIREGIGKVKEGYISRIKEINSADTETKASIQQARHDAGREDRELQSIFNEGWRS